MAFDSKTIGRQVHKLRLEKGLSVSALAKEIGILDTSLNNIESGRKGVGYDLAIRFCRHLDVSMDYLMGLTDDPTHHR